MKRIFGLFLFGILTAFAFSSCVIDEENELTNDSSSSSSNSTASGSSFTADSYIYINLSDATFSTDGSSYTAVSSSTSPVSFNSSETTLLNVDLTDIDAKVGVYISGTNNTSTIGGIRIQSNYDDDDGYYEVGVYLNGATITSTKFPCIYVTKGASATVTLVEGTTNTLTDGRSYGTSYDENQKGALYCKGSLALCGSGSLSVTQGYKNCIATKGNLTVEEGTYVLDSATKGGKHGLYADSSVVVKGGAITFTGKGAISSSEYRKSTGIKTNTDDSTSSVYIKGGTLNITTYNGKGIGSSKVYISGGTNTFNVTGVSGYTSDDDKKSTYYDADGVKYSNTSVTFAPEGIEGASIVQISGGETSVTAGDDALNVSDYGASFEMSGGYLYVYATGGDGIDSNGNITITDGYIVSIAPTGSENALDWADTQTGGYNGSCTITGGYIAGLSGAVEPPDSVSNAGVVILTPTIGSGSSIAIGSSTSNIGYAFTVPSDVDVTSSSSLKFFMCSPKLTDSSYTVYSGCTLSGGSNWNGLYYEMPTVSSSGTETTETETEVNLTSHIYYTNEGTTPGGGSTPPGGQTLM